MSHYRQRQDWQWAFIDLLLLMVGLFSALYIVTLLQLTPPKKNEGIEMKAEMVIVMTWPEGVYDDIDMHMLLPDKSMVHFRNRDIPYATLDRDDRGSEGDVIMGENGTQKINPRNQEVITIRALIPGTYVVNLHVFRQRNETPLNGAVVQAPIQLPYPATVTLKKLNPRYTDLADVQVQLTEVGQQRTAFAFTITDSGDVVTVDTNADMPFIPVRPESGTQ